MTQQSDPDIQSQLLEVKKIIGKSYRQKISDRTGFSTRRVSQIFEKQDISHEIVLTAIEMATEIKGRQASAASQLKKL